MEAWRANLAARYTIGFGNQAVAVYPLAELFRTPNNVRGFLEAVGDIKSDIEGQK
jgi:hypothetical protein